MIARPPPSPSNYCAVPQNSQSLSGAAWNLKTSGFCLNCNRVDVWLNSLVTAKHIVSIWSKVTVTWKPSVSLANQEAHQPVFLTASNIVCTAEWQKRNGSRPTGHAHIWLCYCFASSTWHCGWAGDGGGPPAISCWIAPSLLCRLWDVCCKRKIQEPTPDREKYREFFLTGPPLNLLSVGR